MKLLFSPLSLGMGSRRPPPRLMVCTAVTMSVACSAILGGCSDSCTNHIVSTSSSTDGGHDAVLFRRDCGATTGHATHISVVTDGGSPTGGGNAFVADDDHGVAANGPWGGPWASVLWLKADHLLIRHAAGSRIFTRQESVSGITVSYRPEPSVRP